MITMWMGDEYGVKVSDSLPVQMGDNYTVSVIPGSISISGVNQDALSRWKADQGRIAMPDIKKDNVQ